MKITRAKCLLLIFSIIFFSVALSNSGLTTPDSVTMYVDPPTIADLTLTPGDTFSINVTVSGVEDLWGYTVVLSYNTTVLTVTGYQTYNPFTQPGPRIINDTAGWTYLYYTMLPGIPPGGGVNGTVPLIRIDFSVDALGFSALDLHDTKLASAAGKGILHTEVDGSFTNILIHDVAVTSVTASPYRVDPGGSVTLNVTVANGGDFDETFNVSIGYSSILIGEETGLFLGIGENTTRTFVWDTTGVASGEYTLEAKASAAYDNIPTDNTKSVRVRVGVIRDVAVTNATASQPKAAVGESVLIRVTVKNLGDFSETVTINAYYDSVFVGTVLNRVIDKRSFATVTINWRTGNVTPGEYVVSGKAIIDVDDNPANNYFEGDTVIVGETSAIPIIFVYVAGGLVAIVVVIIILRYALRARKPPQQSG